MPDIHVPKLDDHEEEAAPAATGISHRSRGRSVFRIVLEVALIGTGVFLGLAGEQWRENTRHHELAEASLRRFQSEIVENRKAVAAVKDYHVTTKTSIQAYLTADPKARKAVDVQVKGLQPVFFEQTAWDLALATQSLGYIDADLAFALAHIYDLQKVYAGLTGAMMQAVYLLPPSEKDLDAFFRAVDVYYGDVVLMEPKLLTMYDQLLPKISRALGESPTDKAASR